MKYLKTYEDINSVSSKFNIGDYVRIINLKPGLWKSNPYKIINVTITDTRIEYLLDTNHSGLIWRKEENLKLVPDYELDAEKYNL